MNVTHTCKKCLPPLYLSVPSSTPSGNSCLSVTISFPPQGVDTCRVPIFIHLNTS